MDRVRAMQQWLWANRQYRAGNYDSARECVRLTRRILEASRNHRAHTRAKAARLKSATAIARDVTYKVMAAERNYGIRHDVGTEDRLVRDFTTLVEQARQDGVSPIRIPRWVIAQYYPGQGAFVAYAMTF